MAVITKAAMPKMRFMVVSGLKVGDVSGVSGVRGFGVVDEVGISVGRRAGVEVVARRVSIIVVDGGKSRTYSGLGDTYLGSRVTS